MGSDNRGVAQQAEHQTHNLGVVRSSRTPATRQDIDRLLAGRAEARAKGLWVVADCYRDDLIDMGVRVIDTPDGQVAEGGGTEYELRIRDKQISWLHDEVKHLAEKWASTVKLYTERERVAHERITAQQDELLRLKYGS